MTYNPVFFCLDDADTENKKMNDANTEKLWYDLGNEKKLNSDYDVKMHNCPISRQ